jgi:periplasmic protein TonB
MGIKIVRRCCAGILLGLPCATPWAQDLLPPPAERVQRQADNPLRWIIEAGKLKGRPKLNPEPEAAARASGDKPAPRSGQAKTTAHAKEAVVASAAPARAAAASNPAAAPTVRDEAPLPPPAALELVSDHALVLPELVYAGLRQVAELEVQFTVNPDGSVSDVSVQSSNNPSVEPTALEAVRAWRFKPIAQAQVHSVQLVFHPRP